MHKINLLIALIAIFIFSGCGGGTIGTGNHERTYSIQGSIYDAEDRPLQGIEISTDTSHSSALTDQQGNFQIESEKNESNKIIFRIKGESFYTEAELEIADAQDQKIPVTIKINQVSGIVISVSISETEDSPEKHPSAQKPSASQLYNGRFIGSSNRGIEKVQITENKSKRSAISGKDGRFKIKTLNSYGKVRFNVRYKGLNGSFTLDGVGREDRVDFTVRLSIEESLVDPGNSQETEKILNLELLR